jgi:hypothetical protein
VSSALSASKSFLAGQLGKSPLVLSERDPEQAASPEAEVENPGREIIRTFYVGSWR